MIDYELYDRLENLIQSKELIGEKIHAYNTSGEKKEWTIIDVSTVLNIDNKYPVFSINSLDIKNSMSSSKGRKRVFELLNNKNLFLKFLNENKIPLWYLVIDNLTISSYGWTSNFTTEQRGKNLAYSFQTMQDIINSKGFLYELELDKLLLKHLGMPYYNFIKEKYLTFITNPTGKYPKKDELTQQQKTEFDQQFHAYFKKELVYYYQTLESEKE